MMNVPEQQDNQHCQSKQRLEEMKEKKHGGKKSVMLNEKPVNKRPDFRTSILQGYKMACHAPRLTNY